MSFGIVAGAAVGLMGASMQAGAAEDAAAGQLAGTREANALQDKWMTKNAELQQPMIDAGNLARNRLMYLYGLSPNGTSAAPGASGPSAPDRNAIRQQLIASGKYGVDTPYQDSDNGVTYASQGLDETRLNADLDAQLAQMQAQQAQQATQASAPAPTDADYGSLMRDFGINDYQEDPGYQFRLSEGLKGIDRMAAGRGSFDSGATLKALTRFNSDSASQEYGNAFNRFQVNQGNKVNRLSSLAGNGQTAATTLGNTGMTYAGNVGNNLTNNANAQGAAGIASANGWSNALSNGMNNYQQQNFQNSLLKNLGSSGGWGMQSNNDIAKLWS